MKKAKDQPANQGVVIVDAGGGTIDLSAYSMKLSPTSFEEIAPAECMSHFPVLLFLSEARSGCLQGSIFVTRRAHTLLQGPWMNRPCRWPTTDTDSLDRPDKLSGSNYSSPEIIAQLTSIFDKTTKLRFRNPDEPSYVKFGTVRDKDPKYDIRSGQLKLAGFVHFFWEIYFPKLMLPYSQDVADLFEPSVQAIIKGFEQQTRATSIPVNVSALFLTYKQRVTTW
jgi:hypothetical protein